MVDYSLIVDSVFSQLVPIAAVGIAVLFLYVVFFALKQFVSATGRLPSLANNDAFSSVVTSSIGVSSISFSGPTFAEASQQREVWERIISEEWKSRFDENDDMDDEQRERSRVARKLIDSGYSEERIHAMMNERNRAVDARDNRFISAKEDRKAFEFSLHE